MFSPMSPNPMDHEIEQLENQLEYKVKIMEDLEKQEEVEMQQFSKIMNSKDRQSRSRKRLRTECAGCPSTLRNSCLECKQKSSSKKLKEIYEEKSEIRQQIAEIKTKKNSREDVRELRRPAEIWEEARRKEYEAAQLDADELKNEPTNDDYPQFPNRSTDAEEMQDEDVKMEPSDPIGSIGMPNQIKTEPVDDSPLVNNDVFMNNPAESPLSSSDEDMDSEQADANEAANDNAQINVAPNNDADNALPWWFPYNDELDAYINSF